MSSNMVEYPDSRVNDETKSSNQEEVRVENKMEGSPRRQTENSAVMAVEYSPDFDPEVVATEITTPLPQPP